MSFQLFAFRRWGCGLLALVVVAALAGCQPSAPQVQSTGEPPAAPGAGGTPGSSAAVPGAATSGSVPPDLVQKVESLIRLNDQYCELARQVQDAATFRQHADELSRLEQEASSVTEDIMIAENKLNAAQKAALDRELFVPRAQPSIERKRQEKQRVTGLIR